MTSLVQVQQDKLQLEHFRNLATIASKGGTNSAGVDTLMNIMLTAQDLGISPMKAINGGFYIVNGKISMSTALMADRIRKDGHSIKIPEWTSQKCVIIGVRKDNGDSIKFEYTLEDAQLAGLTSSPTWKKFPKQMLYNRAMSTLARTLFSDVVGNAYSEDEKWDIMNVPPKDRPIEDIDSDIQIISEMTQVQMVADDDILVLESLLSRLDEASKTSFYAWIKKTYSASSLQELPLNAYEKCVASLNAKIKYLKDQEKLEAVSNETN